MRRTRAVGMALLAGLLAAVLAACAGLPVSGPVKLGRVIAATDDDPVVFFNPDDPTPGMTPQQIVEGFLAAATGPRDDWGVARLFLTEDFRDTWEPAAGVTVYAPGLRALTEPAEGQVEVEITPEASVDATGSYTAVSEAATTLSYRLVQEAGEWRIAEAPDGIVLDRNRFAAVFRSYSLMYFDPTWTFLVPDQRWFAVENAATRVTEALVSGAPSPWLGSTVQSAFTEAAGLVGPSVPVRSQRAEVSLRPAARDLDQVTLGRMQTQLQASLETAGVRQVDLLVDGQPLGAVAAAVRSTRVDPRTLVISADAFGFVSGAEVDPLGEFGDVMPDLGADAVELAADRSAAAVLTFSGEVLRVLADGTWNSLDARPGLVDPTMDAAGYIYSVPAADPTGLLALGVDGRTVELAEAWPSATDVFAIRVSRDGTRLAALVRVGGQVVVTVAAIIRGDDGAPTGLGDQNTLGILPGDGIDLAWLDGATLAVLAGSEDGPVVIDQPIGGPSTSMRAPEGAVAVAGGNESGAVRLLDADGRLYGQRGATWSPLVSDVTVLVVQRGTPG